MEGELKTEQEITRGDVCSCGDSHVANWEGLQGWFQGEILNASQRGSMGSWQLNCAWCIIELSAWAQKQHSRYRWRARTSVCMASLEGSFSALSNCCFVYFLVLISPDPASAECLLSSTQVTAGSSTVSILQQLTERLHKGRGALWCFFSIHFLLYQLYVHLEVTHVKPCFLDRHWLKPFCFWAAALLMPFVSEVGWR